MDQVVRHLRGRHSMGARTSFVKEDREVLVRCLEQAECYANFRDGVIGTTCMYELGKQAFRRETGIPVCPLTPRAAPVAVNRTMASRRSCMLSRRVAFCSAVSFGWLGSSVNLEIDRDQSMHQVPDQTTRGRRYFLYWFRSMGNLLRGSTMVKVESRCPRFSANSVRLSVSPVRIYMTWSALNE